MTDGEPTGNGSALVPKPVPAPSNVAPVEVSPPAAATPATPLTATVVPDQSRTTSTIRRLEMEFSYEQTTGPLPPPTMLLAYAKVFPQCAERIVAMAERQAEHRQAMEREALQAEVAAAKRVQYLIGFVCLLTICAGTLLLLFDKKLEGFGVILTPIVTMIGGAWWRHHQQAKSDKTKPEPEQNQGGKGNNKKKNKKRR